MRKIWDIHGGIHPPENKSQSTQTPIGLIDLPDEIILPLNQHVGTPADPIVNIGDSVKKGQVIAEAHGFVSLPVHASTSGEITAIEDRLIPHPSGMSARCIVLKPDMQDEWVALTPIDDFRTKKPGALAELIRNAGIAGMGGAGFPTAVKIQPRGDQRIDTLILNGTECEPYITADDMLMREKAAEVIRGAELLAFILGEPANIIIGIEDNKPEAIAAMSDAAKNAKVEIVSFPTKYPSGGEKQLIQILTGKEVPSGKLPADIGIVLQNIGTAYAAHRAITYGEPLISRVTTIVGESLNIQRNIEVLIGTPMSHVLEQHGFEHDQCARLIVGGPMMGYTMEHLHAPIVKTTNCLLAPTKAELPAPAAQQPCIRCGMCSEACPASLLPQQLFWFSQSEDFDRLHTHNLFDCIECGACAYVCPSNIPLVQYYRASKGAIRQHDEEKRKAEHSRQRFEFRKERIERAAAEKEAQREARKKAAAAARQKQAENAESAAATATPKPETTSPDKTAAKLERALSSAMSRLERAQKQVADALETDDTARTDTLQARLKQAELKVDDAKKRLDAFKQNNSDAKAGVNTIEEQNSASEKLEQSIVQLEKRLATAQQKLAEAVNSGLPTISALEQGVAKIRDKLKNAKEELANINNPETDTSASTDELKSAEAAISKAQTRAAELANMNPADKAVAKIVSLEKRLDKARERLSAAEANNDENLEVFRASVVTLEKKLADAKAKN